MNVARDVLEVSVIIDPGCEVATLEKWANSVVGLVEIHTIACQQ